ncbi:MAG: response regulator [Rhodospirillales bacterium]|nr:response regulator [Rhodospirillales bacterium]
MLRSLDQQRALVADSERAAAALRADLARMVRDRNSERALSSGEANEELRVMLEESTMLAQELHAANEALAEANRELDRRVSERTAQLDAALVELERMNAELNRRVEEESTARAAAQAELFQAQKLDAIGQLTGGIAHDFNNLLTVIINGMQLLGQPRMDDERRARLIRRTEEAAWRGADLTRQLLTFARRQPLHPERIDLARQFESLYDLLVHSLRDDITVQTEFPPELWPVEADLGALELAVLNLAVNARDAMPSGGTITLSACNRTLTESWSGALPGDYVELVVRDTGSGMAPDVLARAFEPFFTTKGRGEGTGLGLAQVYGFAKQSSGSAWVGNAANGGAEVHMVLPRSTRPPPGQSAARETNDGPQAPRISILVVEDDDDLGAAVLEMLEELGHAGTRVPTVAAALAALSGQTPVDLVFSDVLLPGGSSGLDLAREMQRGGIQIPMILTSGYGGDMTEALASVNLPFLRKPYQIEALRRAIDEAIRTPPALS